MDLVARTHRGRVRERNEDCVAVDERCGVAVLADGMGGLPHGEVASREAVAAALAHLQAAPADQPSAVAGAISAANRHLQARADDGSDLMGTTLVAARIGSDGACQIAHVGDSRAYVLRPDGLELLTRDHSLVQDLVAQGLLRPEQARRAPNRNVITRAVGLEATLESDRTTLTLDRGEILLLCSDGLWDMLEDEQIAALLADCGAGRQALERCADRLVTAANAAGGLDNVSVVLARR